MFQYIPWKAVVVVVAPLVVPRCNSHLPVLVGTTPVLLRPNNHWTRYRTIRIECRTTFSTVRLNLSGAVSSISNPSRVGISARSPSFLALAEQISITAELGKRVSPPRSRTAAPGSTTFGIRGNNGHRNHQCKITSGCTGSHLRIGTSLCFSNYFVLLFLLLWELSHSVWHGFLI